MSDLLEHLVNFYHMRFLPTVKRMCDRRRISFTLLTVGILVISVVVLSLLVFSAAESLTDHAQLVADHEAYLDDTLTSVSGSTPQSAMPEMRDVLAMARAEIIATALFGGILWLLLSVLAVGKIMSSVIEAESYVYGLFMIYGAGRKQLRNQLSTECMLAGVIALMMGIPAGYGIGVLTGGAADFPWSTLWGIIPCFLLLIFVCAAVLARRVLGRTCMRMLNSADTSEFTVSPRRSHKGGLVGRRGTVASAALAMWRMRKHYLSLSLAVAVLAALVCGALTPVSTDDGTQKATYTLQFPSGVDSDTLAWDYVDRLDRYSAVSALEYGITDTAEALGTHVLLDEKQNGTTGGVPLGRRYATASFRIACGDGDTYDELGGRAAIPEEFRHIPLTEMSDLGYKLDAVPVGYATYVYPAGSEPPLSLQVGDTVRLYLPKEGGSLSERVETETDYITVRINDIVEIGSIYVTRGGPEVCPRITEDYLYLNPLDYEKFDGQTHAEAITAEEAFPSDLFQTEDKPTCILVVPREYFNNIQLPTHVTVISPVDTVKMAFSNDQIKETLPDHTYFINLTANGTGVYLGTEKEYLNDKYAGEALTDQIKKTLSSHIGNLYPSTVCREYEIETVIYTEGNGHPYLILPYGEEINYSSLQFDVCAFRLGGISDKAPQLMAISEEAFLVETDELFGPSFFGRFCFLGTTLLPDFVATMKAHGLTLQFPEEWFAHTETVIRNSFSLNGHSYLLTEYYPYLYENGILQAEEYPRLMTGVGSFIPIGNTKKTSFLSAADLGIFGLFDEDSIGRLQNESVEVAGLYARNDWMIVPEGEVSADMTLPAGHAVYVTNGTVEACPIRVGDMISVAIRQDTSTLQNDPELMSLAGERLLDYLLERMDYRYVEVVVDEVRHGSNTALVLSESDLMTVLGQTGTYTDLQVYLSPTVNMSEYMQFHTAIKDLVKQSGNTAVMTYDERFITDTAAGSNESDTVLRTMGHAAVYIIPLVLLAAQFVFYGKRSEEFDILRAVGKTPRERRRLFTVESGLFACLAGLCTAAMCPVGYLFTLFLADIVELPLMISDFDLLLYAALVLTVMVSCLLSGLLAYLRTERNTSTDKRHKRAASPRGDIRVPPHHTKKEEEL